MVQWRISTQLEDYEAAVAFMEAQVDAIVELRVARCALRDSEEYKEQEWSAGARPSHEPVELCANGQSGDWRGAQINQEGSAGARPGHESAKPHSFCQVESESREQKAQTVCLREPSANGASPIAEVSITGAVGAAGATGKRPEQRQNNNELIWLLEHPPLYTAGTSAKAGDLLEGARFPVFHSGRGGQFTYHGPGQRVAYAMLDLKTRYAPQVPDLRDYVQKLERWLIVTLTEFGVKGELRNRRIGVWVATPAGDKKIAALGVRVRQGVSYHGVALNVCPDLSHFAGIVPCGVRDYGVTSLQDLGIHASMEAVDRVMKEKFAEIFR